MGLHTSKVLACNRKGEDDGGENTFPTRSRHAWELRGRGECERRDGRRKMGERNFSEYSI